MRRMKNTLVLIRFRFHQACDKVALAIKLVQRRSMSDMCVVDFPSLLQIPMLERIAQR
jgi:hypothetical protein